ncbi:MAG TPA: hypothetical protein VI039_07430 [Solirubrobacterales bacterium]
MAKRFSYSPASDRRRLIAAQLQLPGAGFGFLAGAADLLNPFAPFTHPKSSALLLRQSNEQRRLETLRQLRASALKANSR